VQTADTAATISSGSKPTRLLVPSVMVIGSLGSVFDRSR
jgi:hypothetical protein